MRYAAIIPARYQSSRFPGKPLIDLDGKSMIQRVWERCTEALGDQLVYVATDDERIQEHCSRFTNNIVLTSEHCLTGTDRVAEAARALNLDYAINAQGDEPLIKPSDVLAVQERFEEGDCEVVNAMCPVLSEDEFYSLTVPKVVVDPECRLVYMSRAGIPGNKSGTFTEGWKQVCIYAFSRRALEIFASQAQKTPLEEQEDIEILRFLELGFEIRMVRLAQGSIAIDTPEDREKVLKVLHDRGR